MKTFRSYISEELNSRQKYFIDREISLFDDSARDTDFSDHVFGGPSSGLGRFDDKDVKIIPFNHEVIFAPHRSFIEKHLGTLGYKIHDWDNRLAIRADVPEGKKTNPIKIRKIISSSGHSDPGIISKNNYANLMLDQHDTVAPLIKKGLEIMFTRHPYHVAEQSTNKGWRSCMALGTCPDEDRGFIGDMEHKEAQQSEERARLQAIRLGRAQQAPGEHMLAIPGDIAGGTHIAYLIRKGDYKLKNPLARLSLKPFHSDDIEEKIRAETMRNPGGIFRLHMSWNKIKPDHTILRPVGRVYHLRHLARHPIIDEFKKLVTDFTNENFPMRQNVYSYKLDDHVQRDHGQETTLVNPQYRSHHKG